MVDEPHAPRDDHSGLAKPKETAQPGESFSREHDSVLWFESGSGSDHPGGQQANGGCTPDHGMTDHSCFSNSRLCWTSSRTRFCSALLSEEYSPCFQRERRDLAKPSGVRGPVLAPPCIRQRPLRIAGDWHAVPRRVLAPHLGALFGSPGGFPFFSHLLRGSGFCSVGIVCVIFRGSLSTTVMAHGSNDRLNALIDIYTPHDHLLAELAAMAVQSLYLRREHARQLRDAIDVAVHFLDRLAVGRPLDAFHDQTMNTNHLSGE